MEQKRKIEIGSQVYLEEGGDPCGAVRDVGLENSDEITIYVENSESLSFPWTSLARRTTAKLFSTERDWIRACSMQSLTPMTPRSRAFKCASRRLDPTGSNPSV